MRGIEAEDTGHSNPHSRSYVESAQRIAVAWSRLYFPVELGRNLPNLIHINEFQSRQEHIFKEGSGMQLFNSTKD